MQQIESNDGRVKIKYIPDSDTFEFSTDKNLLKITPQLLQQIINGEIKNDNPIGIGIQHRLNSYKEPWETLYTFREYIPVQNEGINAI